jgi:Domain of Unknown Function (DUF1080)
MKTYSTVLALAVLAVVLSRNSYGQAPASGPKVINFDSDAIGSAPAGFEFARTGGGAEGKWVVRDDKDKAGNRVLVQESADKTDSRFPLAVVRDGTYKDVRLSVRAKPLSGDVDQGFGLVWRYQDANNYYIARCNADEDNCTIYHVVKGSRRAFQNRGTKVATNTWHTLKMEATGDHFTVWFDGTKVLDAKDDTFKDAGKVGLWTKADSVIAFDDLTIEGH